MAGVLRRGARRLRGRGPLLAGGPPGARRAGCDEARLLAAAAAAGRRPAPRGGPPMIVGLGMDLVEIARVERLLRSKGDRALARLFTAREVAYSARRSEPARHFAARLAAKEAAFKALAGNALARAVSWRDIEVISGADGSPTVELRGRGA